MAFELDTTIAEDVAAAREVVGRLAGNDDLARLAVTAFRAQDHQTFRDTLGRLELLDRCDIVCDWLCSKHCVLRCVELCGVDDEKIELNLGEWAGIVAKLSAEPAVLVRLSDAFLERNRDDFQAILDEVGLRRYCHYVCHWICDTWCRLVCDVLCRPGRPHAIIACRQLVLELRRTGDAIGRLTADRAALGQLVEAVSVFDCEVVRDVLTRVGLAGRCRWICGWICSWRCVRVCSIVCRRFPVEPISNELDELSEFTKVVASLSPEVLIDLAGAVEQADDDRFAEIIEQHGLVRYCHQICAWLCRLHCRRFCVCVCRPGLPRPWFTHVGHFHIYGDIDASSGLTNKVKLGHGGPGFGFHNCLELRGFCPADSPIASGAPMRYRFVYQRGGSSTPLLGSLLCPVIVGSRSVFWDINGTGLEETFQTIVIAGAGSTPNPTPTPVLPPGTPWGAPPDHVIVPDLDGWIDVDQTALGNAFNGALIGFNTDAALPGGPPNPGVPAGTAVPSADQRLGVDIAIVFEATRIGGPTGPPDHSNTLTRIHINNWNEVTLLDLLQFHTGGGTPCSELGGDLDIEYTADHELMRSWAVGVASSGSFSTGVLPSGTDTRSGGVNVAAGTHHEDITTWDSCSYRVTLVTQRALTDGLTDDSARTNLMTFCKG